MVALFIGFLFIAFSVFAVLPGCLGWGAFVIEFLKGAVPVLALISGFVSILIGAADIKNKTKTKKEELAAAKIQDGTDK